MARLLVGGRLYLAAGCWAAGELAAGGWLLVAAAVVAAAARGNCLKLEEEQRNGRPGMGRPAPVRASRRCLSEHGLPRMFSQYTVVVVGGGGVIAGGRAVTHSAGVSCHVQQLLA